LSAFYRLKKGQKKVKKIVEESEKNIDRSRIFQYIGT
jgi:hypothetical protein